MKTFIVNGITYRAKAFDFNTVCDLEDMGVSLQDASKKPMSLVRAYFAICSGKEKEEVGAEMEAHLIAGGTFDDVMSVMAEEMNNSDFFRHLNKTTEEATQTSEKKSRKKTTEI